MAVDLSRDIVLRWDDPDPVHVPLLKQGGISGVLPQTPHEAFSAACSAAGIATLAPSDLQFMKLNELGKASEAKNAVLTTGMWPGVTRPPAVDGRGDETASASREPWVDSNGYWIQYLRTLYPDRPAVLGYIPDLGDRGVPFDSVELALVEAWSAGGNYILSVEPYYRSSLLKNEPKAVAAWKQLGQTARWLREHAALFQQPPLPIVTALVEPGNQTAELANLLYRRNASPRLCRADEPPPADAKSRLVLVAANLREPAPATAGRILAHAVAGTTVVTAAPPQRQWWRSAVARPVRSEPDRDFYALGKGQVVAYRTAIADPSEFALDVIDLATHRNRAVRLWNAPTVIAVATESPRRGERLVHLVNYGSPIDIDVQLRVQGHFAKASLLRPDAAPLQLKTAKRGSTSEVQVPELRRLGVLIFAA